jgi:hypothetical protein
MPDTPSDSPKKPGGKPGRCGPAKGNINGLKNGTRALNRLVVGELPKQLLSVRREGRAYRRNLESAVLSARGNISTTDCHHIDTASACTIHAGICRWLLRNKISTMTTADVLNCSREITKAKAGRDAAIRALNLDVKPEAPWAIETTADSPTDLELK